MSHIHDNEQVDTKYIDGHDFKGFNSLTLPENCVALPTYLAQNHFYIIFCINLFIVMNMTHFGMR